MFVSFESIFKITTTQRLQVTSKLSLLFVFLLSTNMSLAANSVWYSSGDPLQTKLLSLPKLPDGYIEPSSGCGSIDLTRPISLAEVANASLCNNPQTSEVWANTRVQAAQLGIAKSAYLPNISDNISSSSSVLIPQSSARNNPTFNLGNSLVASYLLYDFGNRDANLENARQLLLSASASQSSTVQAILLSATVAFYQVQANIAALTAAREAEQASSESFKAADARYKVGVSTPADKLQAQTAYAQLTLARITNEGNLQTAYGNLANVMGLPANKKISIISNLTAEENMPANILEDVNVLIEQASVRRPDLIARAAQVKAAEANIDASKAAAKPSVSVSMSNNWQDGSGLAANNTSTLGLSVSIPIFYGYAPSYRIRAAEATADLRVAQRDRLRLQISLDVWTAYQSLRTANESVTATNVLVKSAEESYRVGLGRYKAGVGNIIDTLNAQSALASARQQKIQASLNSNIARATLAQSIGALDNAMIQSLPSATVNNIVQKSLN